VKVAEDEAKTDAFCLLEMVELYPCQLITDAASVEGPGWHLVRHKVDDSWATKAWTVHLRQG
jgi:hypothetical protein